MKSVIWVAGSNEKSNAVTSRHLIGLNKKSIGKLPRGWDVDNTGTSSFVELKGKLSKEASL